MEIRPARSEDGPAFLELVQCLADFEKLEPPGEAEKERLLEHAFAPEPLFQLWVAQQETGIVAYAAWFLTYSSFRARPTLYLEDLFVHPHARLQGVAKRILAALKQEAIKRECGRFEWSVLEWNRPAVELYERIGARKLPGWQLMRIDL